MLRRAKKSDAGKKFQAAYDAMTIERDILWEEDLPLGTSKPKGTSASKHEQIDDAYSIQEVAELTFEARSHI